MREAVRDRDKDPRLDLGPPSRPHLSVDLLAWLFFLLLPTIVFKVAMIEAMWHRKAFWSTVVSPVADPRTHLLGAFGLFRSDILGLALFTAAAWLAGVRLLRIPLRRLAPVTVLLVLVVGGVEWLALEETGALASLHIAAIAWHWFVGHPGIILHFHPFRMVALLATAVLWPLAFAWLLMPGRRAHALAAIAAGGAVVLLAALLAGPGPMPHTPAMRLARQGFWLRSAAALHDGAASAPLPPPPTLAELRIAIRAAVYPHEPPTAAPMLAQVSAARIRPRHVILVTLETAPRKYYPITDNPEFPAFAAMSRQAIVSERHYTTRTFSAEANYSLVNGLYPRGSQDFARHGSHQSDGLGVVLARAGYESTYIDSYKLDWLGDMRYQRLWSSLGFTRLVDMEREPLARAAGSFERKVAQEQGAFRTALTSIDSARSHQTAALVVIATAIGHFDWPAAPEHRDLPAARRLYELAHVLDRVMGDFLRGLDARGLGDSVIVVVAGDHGLRYQEELASLGEGRRQPDVGFNVPFLLYAPGLLPHRVRAPFATSHVDVAPTVLALLGIPADGLVFHGGNMLDSTLADRAVFLMNKELSPYDYLLWHDRTYELDPLMGEVAVVGTQPGAHAAARPLSPTEAQSIFASALHAFDLTSAYFLSRGSVMTPPVAAVPTSQ